MYVIVLNFLLTLFFFPLGMVDWKEYYVHFLLAKGHPIDKAKKHVEDYDEIDLNFDGLYD